LFLLLEDADDATMKYTHWLVFLTNPNGQSGKSMIDAGEFEYKGGLHIG
jgi:hypothetical protein